MSQPPSLPSQEVAGRGGGRHCLYGPFPAKGVGLGGALVQPHVWSEKTPRASWRRWPVVLGNRAVVAMRHPLHGPVILRKGYGNVCVCVF